ncbi:polyphenol oxidase family protein [Jonesia quinghaiensis]|uniref:polyphenol oxidase family protein n=1 Tax=Jonesia quinghaiensis TaxID=262806 RepID=UPI00041069FF|nr:polyphenol oxidase family protein [Jonesia quinghaiensis]
MQVIDLPFGHQGFVTDAQGGLSKSPYETWNIARHVGDDPATVQGNIELLDQRVGRHVLFAEQVHGNAVAVVECGPVSHGVGAKPVGQADALLTNCYHQAIAIVVADCVPIIVVGDNGWAAAVHAGRQGLEVGVIEASVHALRDTGAQHVFAVVGPAICGECYEVSQDVADSFTASTGHEALSPRGINAHPRLDLRGAAIAQLEKAGSAILAFDERCTYESDTLYSHRRATHAGHVTGRFAMGVALCHVDDS